MPIEYTDSSLMPLGKYKGLKLVEVPPEYLIFLYDQSWFDRKSPLGIYIHDVWDHLKQEIINNKNLNK